MDGNGAKWTNPAEVEFPASDDSPLSRQPHVPNRAAPPQARASAPLVR